jgi:hypothetical protein
MISFISSSSQWPAGAVGGGFQLSWAARTTIIPGGGSGGKRRELEGPKKEHMRLPDAERDSNGRKISGEKRAAFKANESGLVDYTGGSEGLSEHNNTRRQSSNVSKRLSLHSVSF